MKDEGSMPKKLNLELRNKGILQVWIHHAGKMVESGGYGDKTAEFLMDTNIALSPYMDDSQKQIGIEMVFQKKRKEEPINAAFYATKVMTLVGGSWTYIDGAEPHSERRRGRPTSAGSITSQTKAAIRRTVSDIDKKRRNAGFDDGVIPRERIFAEIRDNSGIYDESQSEDNFRKTFNKCLKDLRKEEGKFDLDKRNLTVKRGNIFDALNH